MSGAGILPMFFGDTRQPLFGVYHGVEGRADRAALIASPVGHEYFRAHKLCRQLAMALGRAGVPALRFDYSGTGNSFGAEIDCTLDRWRADLATATAELRDLSGCRSFSLIGIRLGATLAATTRSAISPDHLVLWDPVEVGSLYLESLADLDAALMRRAPVPPEPRAAGSLPQELVGLPLSECLHQELQSAGNLAAHVDGRADVMLVTSEDRSEYRTLEANLRARDVACDAHVVSEGYSWTDRRKIDVVITAPAMTQLVVQRVAAA